MKIKKKRKKILLVSILLVFLVTVGGTMALLIDKSSDMINTFTPGHVTTEVEEVFDSKVKTNVSIKNTGNIDAFIRAMVVITWQNENGDVLGQRPIEGEDYDIVWEKDDWLIGDDNLYYYSKVVKPSEETGVLFTDCKQLKAAPEDGYTLNVEVIGSGIQNKPASVFDTNWSSSGYTVSSDCTTIE